MKELRLEIIVMLLVIIVEQYIKVVIFSIMSEFCRGKCLCFFHNLHVYDGHMLIRALKEHHEKPWVIPTYFDKYMSIPAGRLLFLVSLQFMLQGLDSLVIGLLGSWE